MLTIEDLKKFGANTDEGLGRCLNNNAFYFRLVEMGLKDKGFDALGEALSAGDTSAAFEAAHALKGTMSNLALTPIAEPLGILTETLRSRTRGVSDDVNTDELYAQVREQLEKARALLA